MTNKVLREIIKEEIKFLNKDGLERVLCNIYDLKSRYTTTNIKGKIKIKLSESEKEND